MNGIPIKDKFKHLSSFLVGTPAQFLLISGEYYCVREGCEECPYFNKGCESQEEDVSAAMIPPARRAVGLEERSFLILQLLPGKEFRFPEKGEENPNLVPVSLWNTPRDPYSLDERNLHFVLSDLKHPFRVMKGQFRFYGTKEEFEKSEYSRYFSVFNEYVPQHHIVAFDFSAIEPRGSAIASKEPKWLAIYEGVPKVIIQQIQTSNPLTGKEKHILIHEGKTYCFLLGDLDGSSFNTQCKNCKLDCKVIKQFKKNIPGDFHGLNAKAFFSNEPDWPFLKEGEQPSSEQKEILKKYRDISKVCGLAAVYGAKAWTLAKNMGCSEQEAQKRLDNFFSTLTHAKKHMLFSEQNILKTGKSRNFFGRIWDVSKWVHSQAPTDKERRQDLGYAIRIGYNHPIQSSMAEVLKISMIRVDEHIQKNKWSPLYGPVVPRNYTPYSYKDFVCSMLLSIHDEEDFLVRTQDFDAVLPSVYQVLQVRDVIKSLGVDFSLEMDVEYDLTRSFTSTTKYSAAKIHLINTILPSSDSTINPNMIVLRIEDLNTTLLEQISKSVKDNGNILLGIKTDKEIYIYPKKVTEEFVESLGITKYKAFFSGEMVGE